MAVRKTDRRTLMTKSMIKDALLTLLAHTPYEKITVTAICRQAEITRTTFYLHYDNIDTILDELLDDALQLSEFSSRTDNRDALNDLTLDTTTLEPGMADNRDAALPACQRAASTPKYHVLFTDESLSHHLLNKLYRLQRPQRVPEIMRDYHLSEWEAEKIFLYMLYGNFAVNSSLGWKKTPAWYHIQQLIQNLIKP